jgi:hypothetical protein
MKLYNLDKLVSCEITKEHKSTRFYVRPSQQSTQYFGLVIKLEPLAVGDRKYRLFNVSEFSTPVEFVEKNGDRYDIVDETVWCKAEVRLQFEDGQAQKYYFSKYEDAITWTKSLPTRQPISDWLQA